MLGFGAAAIRLVMSEANKALVRRFVSEWLNDHDAAAFRRLTTDDYVAHWGIFGEGHGSAEVERMEQYVLDAFPDLRAETEWMIANGDRVVQRTRMTATHQGKWFGVEPTGKSVEWTADETYRIEGHKIAEQWLSEDWTYVLRQIGGLPAP